MPSSSRKESLSLGSTLSIASIRYWSSVVIGRSLASFRSRVMRRSSAPVSRRKVTRLSDEGKVVSNRPPARNAARLHVRIRLVCFTGCSQSLALLTALPLPPPRSFGNSRTDPCFQKGIFLSLRVRPFHSRIRVSIPEPARRHLFSFRFNKLQPLNELAGFLGESPVPSRNRDQTPCQGRNTLQKSNLEPHDLPGHRPCMVADSSKVLFREPG